MSSRRACSMDGCQCLAPNTWSSSLLTVQSLRFAHRCRAAHHVPSTEQTITRPGLTWARSSCRPVSLQCPFLLLPPTHCRRQSNSEQAEELEKVWVQYSLGDHLDHRNKVALQLRPAADTAVDETTLPLQIAVLCAAWAVGAARAVQKVFVLVVQHGHPPALAEFDPEPSHLVGGIAQSADSLSPDPPLMALAECVNGVVLRSLLPFLTCIYDTLLDLEI